MPPLHQQEHWGPRLRPGPDENGHQSSCRACISVPPTLPRWLSTSSKDGRRAPSEERMSLSLSCKRQRVQPHLHVHWCRPFKEIEQLRVGSLRDKLWCVKDSSNPVITESHQPGIPPGASCSGRSPTCPHAWYLCHPGGRAPRCMPPVSGLAG